MNRRNFLRFVGAAAVGGLLATNAVARVFRAPGLPQPWPEGMESPEYLRLAIERLFPAGAINGPARAFTEFDDQNRVLGLDDEEPGAFYKGEVYRVIPATFALGYYITDEMKEDGLDYLIRVRLHKALYRAMYRTWETLAARSENKGALLVWRRHPEEWADRKFEDDQEKVVLRLRAGLLPQGWRRSLGVAPNLIGSKPEGANTLMVGS